MQPFGKFELLAPLAYGGMAELFIARQSGMAGVERLVVIKRILPHLATQPHFIEMFLEEARIAALLDHPNIVPIYDLGHVEGAYFIAMPYISGITVRVMMEINNKLRQSVPVEVACSVVLQVLEGLSYAHRRKRIDGAPLNLVHRDITPSNVMLEQSGRAILLDFGIAKAADRINRETETGSIKGKLTYMSPEQCRGDPLDQRSDLFSLGVLFHEMVTGTRLFRRKTDMLVYKAIAEDEIPNPQEQRPELPSQLADLIMRSLAREQANRPSTAEAMSESLLLAMKDGSIPNGGRSLVASFLAEKFGEQLEQRQKLLLAPQEPTKTIDAPPPLEMEETRTSAGPTGPGNPELRAEPPARRRRLTWIVALVLVLAAGLAAALVALRGPSGPPIRLGVAPYLPAKVLQNDLAPLAAYLQRELDRPVKIVVPSSYDDTVNQLLDGRLELADLPPYPYLMARRKDPKVKLLAMVVSAGATSYEAYLVVRRAETGIDKIDDLKNRRVCYVDRRSTSGYLVARAMVRKAGFDPDALFSEKQFSGNHHQALHDLLAKRCDVAAVYSGAYLSATSEGIAVGRTRILAVSGKLPDDVICAAPSLPAGETQAIQAALLAFDARTETGRAALGSSVPITGFVAARVDELEALKREIGD